MRITPYTPVSVLRKLAWNTFYRQAIACLLSAMHFSIVYYCVVVPPFRLFDALAVALNLIGGCFNFLTFNSAAKARVALLELIAIRQEP